MWKRLAILFQNFKANRSWSRAPSAYTAAVNSAHNGRIQASLEAQTITATPETRKSKLQVNNKLIMNGIYKGAEIKSIGSHPKYQKIQEHVNIFLRD